jgi:Flp pilus assembly protein TadG
MLRLTGLPGRAAGRARTGRRQHSDRGSVAVFTVVFAIAVVALTALIVDGGIAMNARERAADIAGQAARAAASDIDVTALRTTGTPQIGPGACAAANQLVTTYAHIDSGGVDRVDSVSVVLCSAPQGAETATVRVQVHTTPLVGGIIGGFTEAATQTATAECGITQGAEC